MHNTRRLSVAVTIALAGLGLMGTSASALIEAPQNAQYEIPLPWSGNQIHIQNGTQARQSGEALAEQVSRKHGGAWQTSSWNPVTGTPHYLLGSGIELNVALGTDAAAEAAARQFVDANPEIFGATSGDLRLFEVRRGRGKVAVHFDQLYRGIPVREGRVHLTFGENGRLFVMGSDFHRDIALNPVPSLGARQAVAVAQAALPYNPSSDRIEGDPGLLVLPVPLGPAEVAYRLVWQIRVRTEEPLGIWVTHVDAHSGEIVWRYNDIQFLDYSGSASGDVEPSTWCNGSEVQPLRYARVSVDGLGTVTTDGNGNWNAGEGGTGTRLVTSELAGPFVNVDNMAGPDAQFTGTATAGVPFPVMFSPSNSQNDERDVFAAISDLHDFFEILDPGYSYANFQIDANVSRNATCNAYWDGTINFYRAGDGCANTGEIQGVVHHEFVHGVQNDLLGGQGNEGLGEGNADVAANLLTQESIIGRGFHLGDCVGGIRNSDNTLVYPDNVVGQEIHFAGQVIAGFHWDIMVALQAQLGQQAGTELSGSLWHFARKLETPVYQPDQVVATFIVDDDDANLANGTPNYDAICDAAYNHGFGGWCPEILEGVIIAHTPLETTTSQSSAHVVANIVSTESSINEVTLSYSINSVPFVHVPMYPNGNPNEYEAIIPGFQFKSEVAYYLSADDAVGNSASSPRNAPADVYHFDVAHAWDPMEFETGWVVNAEGTDDATSGIWIREDPNGTIAQPEDDHSPLGTACWVTGNAPGGGAGADDVDGGTTTLFSPSYNLSGAFIAKLKYWRWYSNDRGSVPNEDYWRTYVRNNGGPWITLEGTQSDQNIWHKVLVNLMLQFGGSLGQVEMRFEASDVNHESLVEAAVDDLTILADFGSTIDVPVESAPSGVPAASYLAGARPNPFTPRTTIRYGLTSASPVTLGIYDVSGRRVRSLVNTNQAAGHYALAWDGRDDGGHAVGAGTYYSRLDAGSYRATEKLTLIR